MIKNLVLRALATAFVVYVYALILGAVTPDRTEQVAWFLMTFWAPTLLLWWVCSPTKSDDEER